jgi:hypothetical protein
MLLLDGAILKGPDGIPRMGEFLKGHGKGLLVFSSL